MSDYFDDKDPRELKQRILYVTILVVILFSGLAIRFWSLQALHGTHFKELSENNRIRTLKSVAPRGIIYDRTGAKLADNRPGFDLYIVPEDVTDWSATKKLLGNLIALDAKSIDKKLEKAKARPKFQPIRLKEDLSWEETVKVESYKFEIEGIFLEVAPKRQYLYNESIAHVLGYLGEVNERELKRLKEKGYTSGDLIGRYGLEKSYETELKGKSGIKEVEVDAVGRKIKVVNWSPPYPGNDLALTIDLKTQQAAWEAMKEVAGAAIAIEPSSGRVLAMLSTPSFDPNLLSSGITNEQWKELIENPLDILTNRAIQGQYPPASTFKPLHAIAALEEGELTPETIIHSGPSFWFGGREYRDWKGGGHGKINVHRAIVESSDTFFYQVALKLGIDRLAKYSKKFGLGKKTGIKLQNEKAGLVPSVAWKSKTYKKKWYTGETISAGVGQGYFLSTPLQLINVYAAIANSGTLYRPQLVEEVLSPTGKNIKNFIPEVLAMTETSPETFERVRRALLGVVEEEGGTARSLRWAKLGIAGKTGTAQVAKLGKIRPEKLEDVPYRLRDHAWFAGFAPYDNPKIVVVVLVEHGGFGSAAAAPVARKIFKAYLDQLKPDDTKKKQ
ncbi:MAG: penicillin-binding protein 2 [Proteobacteria bacterium]|nr:penicillin-binding protein 2 [Pseudomonadota bacterium]